MLKKINQYSSRRGTGADYQKSKVYKWESQFIAKDTSVVPYDGIQTIIDYIWANEGWKFPPQVRPLNKAATTIWARGDRSVIDAPERGLPTIVILHELSHTLTSVASGEYNDGHGPDFVGCYMKLLEKYMQLPILVLIYTAKEAGVEFNLNARPYFLD